MNKDEREQINRLALRAKSRAARNFGAQLEALTAKNSASGHLQSGATIKAAIRQMDSCIREEFSELQDSTSLISQTEEAYIEFEKAIQTIMSAMTEELPKIIRLTGDEPGGAKTSLALGLFHEMKSDVEAELILARHGFISSETQPKVASEPKRNRGGRPMALHWDRMWAHIAVMLCERDLQPKTQADIEAAMANWFASQSIEIGESTIRGRARALWQEIEGRKD